ncbi:MULTISPECIES: ATP-binding protein [unclassified Streptomyces]|uniref:ATP-binding protein n=1 Tax=unclassified Streptomyces TaxID=2593676 RepID=UPI0013A6BFDE|nr:MULTISPECIES: ATP-binding protein [unclassified Streptomyces]QZZ30779.1 ATP-binding protein [Streptomyces sp. ST1015]
MAVSRVSRASQSQSQPRSQQAVARTLRAPRVPPPRSRAGRVAGDSGIAGVVAALPPYPGSGGEQGGSVRRPRVIELRLSAYANHRRGVYRLGPVTLFSGRSGSGKSSALRAYAALSRLGGGSAVREVFTDVAECVPVWARADGEGRRGFRIGCTADGPEGPVALDVAVQAEPRMRIVGERLRAGGTVLLETALRDPARPYVDAAWHTGGSTARMRAPFPDDQLGTALLPLRVSGRTDAQRRVIAAAEQMVVALRSVFFCDPDPDAMRVPVRPGSGRLMTGCDNFADVVFRTRAECALRHAALVVAVDAGCAGPVVDLRAEALTDGRLHAVLDRGGGITALPRLGDGELRHLGLALALLTGPGVLTVDAPRELPTPFNALTVLADNFDSHLDLRQRYALLELAVLMAERGHLRLLGTSPDASWAHGAGGVTVVHLDG